MQKCVYLWILIILWSAAMVCAQDGGDWQIGETVLVKAKSGYRLCEIITKEGGKYKVRDVETQKTGLVGSEYLSRLDDTRGLKLTLKDAGGKTQQLKLYDRMYAVVIGIDRYVNLPPPQQLKYAVRDAKGVAEVLAGYYRFEKILPLYDEQATKSGIEELLMGKMSVIGEEDGLLVFFAGHGYTEQGKESPIGYLIPHDGSFGLQEMHKNLSMDYLKNVISNKIKAKHVFYIMDSCYSGELLSSTRGGGQKTERSYAFLQQITKKTVRQVLTAGSADQEVLDGGPLGHSVFTGRLIEALQGNREYLTASELSVAIQEEVFVDAHKRHHKQTPLAGKLYGSGEFVFIPDKLGKEQRELQKILAEKGKLAEQQRQLQAKGAAMEQELAEIQRRQNDAKSDADKREAERQQKALEQRQWKQRQQEQDLREAQQRQQQAEAETKARLEAQRKLDAEVARLAQLEAKRQEQELADQARLKKEEAVKQKAEQAALVEKQRKLDEQRRELERRRTDNLNLSQAKTEIERLQSEIRRAENEFSNTVANKESDLSAEYAKRREPLDKQLAQLESYLAKYQSEAVAKKRELLAKVNREKDQFEDDAEYRQRVAEEERVALTQAKKFEQEQRQKLQQVYTGKSSYESQLAALQQEESRKKAAIRPTYTAARDRELSLYRSQIAKLLGQEYSVVVKQFDLGKYERKQQAFFGTFRLGDGGQAEEFVLAIAPDAGRELYKKQKFLLAEVKVKLDAGLSETIAAIAFYDPDRRESAWKSTCEEWARAMEERRRLEAERLRAEMWASAETSSDGRYKRASNGVIWDTQTNLEMTGWWIWSRELINSSSARTFDFRDGTRGSSMCNFSYLGLFRGFAVRSRRR